VTKAIFITVASPQIGGGHVLRCLALAENLGRHGFDPVFAVDRTTVETVALLKDGPFKIVETVPQEAHRLGAAAAARVVIFDGYGIDRAVERQWQGRALVRLVIDDLADRHHDCELLVDHAPGRIAADYAALVPPRCEVLAGPSFALLRPAFLDHRVRALARRSAAAPRRLLVAMGLTDVGGITRRVVEGALLADIGLEIDVVAGRGAESLAWLERMAVSAPLRIHVDINAAAMAELMMMSDLAIGGGGGSSLERCCMGLPSLMILLAENQRLAAETLQDSGAARLIGDLAVATPEHIAAALRSFAGQGDAREQCAKAAAIIVDGGGADRVRRAVMVMAAASDQGT
jgi:UDP-2,4-diacetamido-2,4,6-trideoxy-beta-L-altropyranose hydrolase